MHSYDMHWSQLIDALVRDKGGALAVAKAMGKPTFQGTLHKIASGNVESPSRASAERISTYFKIPIDALYSNEVAKQVYEERFGSELAPGTIDTYSTAMQYWVSAEDSKPTAERLIHPARLKTNAKRDSVVKVLEKLGTLMEDVDSTTRLAISPFVAKLLESPEQASVLARKVGAFIAIDYEFENDVENVRHTPQDSRKSM